MKKYFVTFTTFFSFALVGLINVAHADAKQRFATTTKKIMSCNVTSSKFRHTPWWRTVEAKLPKASIPNQLVLRPRAVPSTSHQIRSWQNSRRGQKLAEHLHEKYLETWT